MDFCSYLNRTLAFYSFSTILPNILTVAHMKELKMFLHCNQNSKASAKSDSLLIGVRYLDSSYLHCHYFLITCKTSQYTSSAGESSLKLITVAQTDAKH